MELVPQLVYVIIVFTGQCLLADGANAPACLCDHGFGGLSCDSCLTHFKGSNCERCEAAYIGYNTTCSVLCIHGDPTELGMYI